MAYYTVSKLRKRFSNLTLSDVLPVWNATLSALKTFGRYTYMPISTKHIWEYSSRFHRFKSISWKDILHINSIFVRSFSLNQMERSLLFRRTEVSLWQQYPSPLYFMHTLNNNAWHLWIESLLFFKCWNLKCHHQNYNYKALSLLDVLA